MDDATSRLSIRWSANFSHRSEQTEIRTTIEISTNIFFIITTQLFSRNNPSNLFPPTEPSFFPLGSSNSTPHHSPAANSVHPMNRRVPILDPWLDFIITLSPSLKSTCVDAKLVLEVAENLFRFILEIAFKKKNVSLKDGGDLNGLKLPLGDAEFRPFTGVDVTISATLPSGSDNGYLVNLVSLEKTPFFGSHWKYRMPPTEPSFLPKIACFDGFCLIRLFWKIKI